jgi:excinuclease ABC subunit A
MDKIIIKGAREHNLKNIDVELPRDKLIVITGLSGSGKSSLAFDTIYAEGQRRYVESLSTYARQFLEQMGKPDLDSIEGLSPAISIEQKSTSKNPRSTVGTVTEIYDYLRLLYARIGTVHCHSCGLAIAAQTVQQMVDRVLKLPEGTRFSVLAPIVRDRKGEYKKELDALRRQGLRRVNVDGDLYDLSEDTIKLDKNKNHTIEVYVDRLAVKPDVRQRLTEAIELSLQLAAGIVKVSPVILGSDELPEGVGITDENGDIIFSERFACINCGISYPEITPRLFSFNNPSGACPACDVLRPRADRQQRRSGPARGGDRAVGEAQRPVLPADPGGGGPALQVRHDDGVVGAAAGDPRPGAVRQQGGRGRVLVREERPPPHL